MTKSNFLKRLLPFLLAFLLVIPSLTAFADTNDVTAGGENDGVSWEKVDDVDIEGLTPAHKVEFDEINTDNYVAAGNVRVSIIVDGDSTIGAGYDTQGIGTNPNAKRYRGEVLANQKSLAKKISAEALGGAELDVVWNLTLAANIISANVPAASIEMIKKVDGVKDVIIENQYEAPVAETGDDPNMSNASDMVGTQPVWANGYTGAGSKVAIIDTGLDTDHQSFASDSFDYAIEQTGKTVDLLDSADVAEVWNELNIASKIPAADADDTYLTTKVPFAANYVDNDLDVTHDNDRQGEHGSHVAGIAAANRFINVDGKYENAFEAVFTQGEAPDAQILVMKVFGKGGGAYDSDYFAAIEDAIVLGADSANLSLGSSVAGLPIDDTYQAILDSLADSNTVVTMSAGNNGTWADHTNIPYLYSDGANLHTGGSPGSFKNSFTIASVDNDGFTGAYIKQGDNMIFYTETQDAAYPNKPFATLENGVYEYVYIDGPGAVTDDSDNIIADQFTAVDVNGKIAICNRGTSSFYQKGNLAAARGAAAVIIANNQSGTISMNLSGYLYPAPCVSITQADGAILKENASSSEEKTVGDSTFTVYYGEVTLDTSFVDITSYHSDYYTMSSFSSWGVPSDLSLKPEITAPGGNIYSVNGLPAGGTSYENMSGTSMAAPQIAGIAAVFKQYIRENGLVEKTGLTERQLTISMLMSTARSLIDQESGYYYSVMNQGAGLVDLDAATNANVFITMDEKATASAADGKIKVELGDDPERDGEYTAKFTLHNFSEEPVIVSLNAEFFTQDIFAYNNATYLDTWTYPLESDVKFSFDSIYDFNGDGQCNSDDTQALLDYVVGNRKEIKDPESADLDNDGDIDTYDAYLSLCPCIPANGSVDVFMDFALLDIDDFDDNGAYIEGYIFAKEFDTEEGVLGVTHSIPVLGYYGSWSEPSMTDIGSYIEYQYKEESREPYMYAALGNNAYSNEMFIINYAGINGNYAFAGNPYTLDKDYHPERNAMSSDDTIAAFNYSLIRNSAGSIFEVVNDNDEVIFTAKDSAKYAAYYYANQATWQGTTSSFKTNFKPIGIAEGTALEMNVTMAPYYYRDAEGNIDWEALHKNATITMPVVIDNTAPVITNVEAVKDEQGNVTALNVTAKDNQYIASIALYDEEDTELGFFPADEKAEIGAEAVYTFEIKDSTIEHFYVFAGDYAANETIYKINLNEEELAGGVTSVTVSPNEVGIVINNSVKLAATVEPWGIDDSVEWSSSDETVATVDANGVVTGVKAGEAVITATSKLDPTKSGTASIEVVEIDKDLNGIVWDENGDVWFSEFNVKNLPDYTKLNSASLRLPIASLTYDQNGVLYGASFDSEEELSDLYVINEDTFEATMIGPSSIAYMDIAAAPSLGENILMGVYGPYVVIIDATTGDYLGAFNFSSYGASNLVGIAYEEQFNHPTYGNTDWYFLLDDTGTVYQAGFLPYNGNYANFTPQSIGQIWDAVDTPYFQSFYYDGTSLFWSRYNAADNVVNIVMVNDIYNDGSIYNLGSFADNVWPVGGLYEKGIIPANGFESASSDKSEFAVDESNAFIERIDTVEFNSIIKGSVNAITVIDKDDLDEIEVEKFSTNIGGTNAEINGSGASAVILEITPDADSEGDLIHNGLYELTYDPEVLEISATYDDIDFKSSFEAPGKLLFGYVDEEGFTVDERVAMILVTRKDKTKEGTLEIKTLDNGCDNPGTIDKYVFKADGGIVSGNGVTGIEFESTEANVVFGETIQLTPVVTPADAMNKEVTYKSADESIATVDENGVVTGVKVGKTTITATTVDGGFTASVDVRVLFKDVTDDTQFYYDYIYALLDAGIVTGYDDGTFGPMKDCSRAVTVTFLWNAAGRPEPKEMATFSDMTGNEDIDKAISWAVEEGITTGWADNTFRPDRTINRAAVVTFLWRSAGMPEPTSVATFKDMTDNEEFNKAISWAVENNITTGWADNTFRPWNTCNRLAITSFIARYLGY